jgi:hypothetical protein
VAREREHRGEIQASTLPGGDFNLFCTELYLEGLAYGKLPPEIIEKVGVHTSIRLHNHSQGGGRWASIHYREGLESFIEGKMKLGRVRDFHEQIGADLNCLSKKLLGDLGDVDMVYGLSQVSANWGGNHSFKTQTFSKHPAVISWHIQSITGLPPQTNGKAPLTLFAISRDDLIGEFYGDGPSAPKEPIGDSVGN